MDYAYKIVLKKCFQTLIDRGFLNPKSVDYIFVNVDEHLTATDGKYELRENLLTEFKIGTFNWEFDVFYKPIFTNVEDVQVKFCDSKSTTLVRAADIIANHFWHSAVANKGFIEGKANTFIYVLPQKVVSSNGIDYFSKNKRNNRLSKEGKIVLSPKASKQVINELNKPSEPNQSLINLLNSEK